MEINLMKLLLLIKISIIYGEDAIVNLKSGTYVGKYTSTLGGAKYAAFKGIKFANVIKRFEEAEAVKDSNQTLAADNYGPPCVQMNDGKVVGVEDCLYLDVFSPNINGSLPVMVFIYGGSFQQGYTGIYSPEYFMDTSRVVIVFISYRIGAFGFLYFDDPKYPANLGLRDQILALRWIQSNIKSFGGDSKRVTIAGQSAGAASVSLLMYSPLAKGLFIGAISESGSGCALWAAQPRCTGLQRLEVLSRKLKCNNYFPKSGKSAEKLVGCLRSKSPELIIKETNNLDWYDRTVPFPPIIESSSVTNPVINVFPWLNKSPVELVPWLTGVNSNEAAGLLGQALPKSILEITGLKFLLYKILPPALFYKNTASNPSRVTRDIIDHDKLNYLFNFVEFLYKVVNEGEMFYPMYKCLEQTPTAYSYYFDYIFSSQLGKEKGVAHGGELKYMWQNATYQVRTNGSKSDINISNSLVNTWIDFAYNQTGFLKFSGVLWEKYNSTTDEVLIINNKRIKMGKNPNRRNNLFWANLKSDTKPFERPCT